MTGLHTGHTPVRGNKEAQPEGQWPMPAETFTLAEMLKGAVMSTGCSVNGGWVRPAQPEILIFRDLMSFTAIIAKDWHTIITRGTFGITRKELR